MDLLANYENEVGGHVLWFCRCCIHVHMYTWMHIIINPYHSEQFCILGQWFLNLIPNLA